MKRNTIYAGSQALEIVSMVFGTAAVIAYWFLPGLALFFYPLALIGCMWNYRGVGWVERGDRASTIHLDMRRCIR